MVAAAYNLSVHVLQRKLCSITTTRNIMVNCYHAIALFLRAYSSAFSCKDLRDFTLICNLIHFSRNGNL